MACKHCCEHKNVKACKGGHAVECKDCGKVWEEEARVTIRQRPPWGGTRPLLGVTASPTVIDQSSPHPRQITGITTREGVITSIRTR